jgi:hypothetical protein
VPSVVTFFLDVFNILRFRPFKADFIFGSREKSLELNRGDRAGVPFQ